MTAAALPSSRSRRLLNVRGVVQGVGFRPTVYRLAVEHGLSGFVRNDAAGVTIEIEGHAAEVAAFEDLLRQHLPVAARLDAIEVRELATLDEQEFRVEPSVAGQGGRTSVPPDLATCDDCLRELFDPGNRRYRYPFITCTNCGPRYTIVRALPYDRARTTMSEFLMCAPCQAEYDHPSDRRFHSQTNACASCGPRLLGVIPSPARPGALVGIALGTQSNATGRAVVMTEGGVIRSRSLASAGSTSGASNQEIPRRASLAQNESALREAVERLGAGEIVAIKGIGGFHLAVDATNEEAVARLRSRKRRAQKPFAVMARNLDAVHRIARVEEPALVALTAPSRPIVCMPKRTGLAPSVAPALSEIGVMLPYAPLHHLLLAGGPALLVMTSGNRSDEPVALGNDEAVERLRGIADAFLLHDRTIHARADDSVVRVIASRPRPIRRSRGMVPETIALPFSSEPILAVGAELKNTVCMTSDGQASLSAHIGDLSHPGSFSFFEETIASMTKLAGKPVAVAHDLHPDYRSTRWALESGLRRVGVQHHHAHIASCLADNERTDRVIGVAFDGTGCGPAGELWGGEILLCDLLSFTRAGHLRPLALAGGEAAIREPWRLAAAALLDAGESLDILERINPRRLAAIRALLERDVRAPRATSAGRWFDAVAALCGVCDVVSYEGEAAMKLETVAGASCDEPYEFAITARGEIDLRPMVRAIAAGVREGKSATDIAARFHETLVQAVAEICQSLPLRTAALSGGCFQNKRLTERMKEVLERSGLEVLLHRRIPANDGGISFGQAAVAAYRCSQGQ